MENDTQKSIYETIAITAGVSAVITGFLGWVGSLIVSTLKKIDDSQDTKAELKSFIKEVGLKFEAIKEDIAELKAKKK